MTNETGQFDTEYQFTSQAIQARKEKEESLQPSPKKARFIPAPAPEDLPAQRALNEVPDGHNEGFFEKMQDQGAATLSVVGPYANESPGSKELRDIGGERLQG